VKAHLFFHLVIECSRTEKDAEAVPEGIQKGHQTFFITRLIASSTRSKLVISTPSCRLPDAVIV